MNALKILWMGVWRLSLGLIVLTAFVYGVTMLVDVIDARFAVLLLFVALFLFFSYGIGEVIVEKRKREEARKSAMAYFDEQKRKDLERVKPNG